MKFLMRCRMGAEVRETLYDIAPEDADPENLEALARTWAESLPEVTIQSTTCDEVDMAVEPRVPLPSHLRLVTWASWQPPRSSKELVFSSTGSFWVERER